MRRLWLAAALASGCGAPGLAVPSHPHPAGALAEPVGFPPPPAPIEHLVGTPPAEGCQWADGQWVWVPQRWDWRPGAWIRPPVGCEFSTPELEWAPGGATGILYYRPGRWYSVRDLQPCPDPVSCPAQSPTSSRPRSQSAEGARSS
jgi:hypothetical protein